MGVAEAAVNGPHDRAIFLTFHWQDRAEKDREGIQVLEQVFEEEYNLTTLRAALPNDAARAKSAVQTNLTDALKICATSSDLLIIYYRGHGGRDKAGGLKWSR